MNENNNISKNLDTLDIINIVTAFLSVKNYGENQEQSKKLSSIIFDLEIKMEEQTLLLKKILAKLEEK